MIYQKSILCVTVPELEKCGISINTICDGLKRQRNNNVSCWPHHKEGNTVYIHYDGLKDNYKQLIKEKLCGRMDPYRYMELDIIKNKLISKPEDVDNLNSFTFPNGEYLSDKHKAQYTEACKYLYLLESITLQEIKKLGFTGSPQFYFAITTLIKANDIPLPTAYSKLREKLSKYKEVGAVAVINGRFGNQNTAKVKDEVQVAFLKELHGKANNLNNEQIAIIYNNKAKEKDWKPISSRTVVNHLDAFTTIATRKGISEFREIADFVIRRKRPSRPNMLWVGDGTPYELYYQSAGRDSKGNSIVKYWNRKVIYVVTDAFNDCIMGFAIGDTENIAIAKQAWKNACTWRGVLPDQIKTDHYAFKEMKPFYERMALKVDFFTPSSVGNPRDKVVEQFFAKVYDFVTRVHPNAAGPNIKAEEQPNRDYLDKIKHSFPDEAGVIEMIANDLKIWNNAARKKLNGKSLEEQWREGDHSRSRKMTDLLRLNLFGKLHEYNHGSTNKLTNKGITPTLGGIDRQYMSFDIDFFRTVGTDYQVVYDPEDYSKILVKADEGRKMYLLDEVKASPMAFGDFQEGDRKALNQKLDFKDAVKRYVVEARSKRCAILEQHELTSALEAEAIAKAMFTLNGDQKQLSYKAGNVLKDLDKPSRIPREDIYNDSSLFETVQVEKPARGNKFNDGY